MKLTDNRGTPQALFDELNKVFDFGLDAAASQEYHKCENWYGPDHPTVWNRDALKPKKNWFTLSGGKWIWLNPPYSRGEIMKWLDECARQVKECGAKIVVLLPADTSTKWFHKHIHPKIEDGNVRFLEGRLTFEGAPLDSKGRATPAKFGSILVRFEP